MGGRAPQGRGGAEHVRRIEKGFYIGSAEVSIGAWRRFAASSGYSTLAEIGRASTQLGAGGGRTLSPDGNWVMDKRATWKTPMPLIPTITLDEEMPVTQIAWTDAMAFTRYYGLDLPTEAQWEYVCRCGSHTKFPWGDAVSDYGGASNLRDASTGAVAPHMAIGLVDDGFPYLAKLTALRPNAWQVHCMAGNACEWTADYYLNGSDYVHPNEDPVTGSGTRVTRGGSWATAPSDAPCSARDWAWEDLADARIGFRVVLNL